MPADARRASALDETALRAVLAWSRLHGFVSLELARNFASMGLDPDQLFAVEIAGVAV